MRTLKKSLCFVLALVFVLGLCTIGSNAAYAKYTDIAKVNYTEAVEVLTGLGVIEGYPDGSFNPTANVTRAEAAAMITRMMLGREDADKLPIGDVKFSDVPETNWAAKYIAFCANKGIIVGMGDGTFRPNENVTGTQMATMLLRALGYGVIGEYEGKGWDINAVADALYYGVFKDSEVTDFNQPATREENALYVWNTMRIELVGYDVDLNYYDGKGITFARQAFNLIETKAWQQPQVLSNQATGDPYTKVRLWEYDYDDDGDLVWDEYAINLNIETGLDLIGHDVTLYYVGESKRDAENHCYYYDCYLVKDESTVIAPFSGFSSLDDLYRALKAANEENVDTEFTDIEKWVNYDYTCGLHVAPVTDYDNMFGPKYYRVSDLKGQRSSMDSLAWMLVGGNWILDRDGNILCVISTSYQVGQVKAIDDVHDEVEVDVWVNSAYYVDPDDEDETAYYPVDWYYESADGDIIYSVSGYDAYDTSDFDTELVDFEKNGIAQTYEGIAEDDYVQVQRVGKMIYLSPTDTVTEEVTDTSESFGSWTINGYSKDSYGFGIPVEDWDDPADVEVGDLVKFYIIKGAFSTSYFAVSIVEKANAAGTVYLNYATVLLEHTDWSLDNIIKVQCITEEGEEVTYKMTATAFAEVGELNEDGDEVVSFNKGAYKAYLRKKGYVVLKTPTEQVKFSKTNGRTSYLKGIYDYYYVTSDTKVIYFSGEADTLEITVSSALAKEGTYDVYAVSKKSGGAYKLTSVWVPDQTAPTATDKIMYVNKSSAYVFGADRKGYDADGTYYDKAYIDGKNVAKAHLVGDDEIYIPEYEFSMETYTFTWDEESLTESIWAGFYYYEYDEESNTYELTPVETRTLGAYGPTTSMTKSLTATLTKKSVKRDGDEYRLYTDYTDGILLDYEIVDVSGGTTKETKTDAAINSAARLYELLKTGNYSIGITYMFQKVEGDSVPVGTIYVTSVTYTGD